MSTYDPELRGALFKADKGDNEKRPDYKGDITIGGVKYWLSAWIAESKKDGSKYMQLKAEVAKPASAAMKPASQPQKQEMIDDDIPW